jgi:hypothetical protein
MKNHLRTRVLPVALVLTVILAFALAGPVSAKVDSGKKSAVNGPVPNPYLISSLYALTHFDSSQSDNTLYGPPLGTYTVDAATEPIVYGGPINIITLASTNKNFMWAVGTDHVSYVKVADRKLTELTRYEALARASDNVLPAIPEENFRTFGGSSAVGMSIDDMDTFLKELFSENYADRFGNGLYPVVDSENVLYVNYYDNLYAFALKNKNNPSAGIAPRYAIEDIVDAIQGENHPAGARLFGLSMTYDGHLIIVFSDGIAVIDRDLDLSSASFYQWGDNEYLTNSVAVDENNGIYAATDTYMRKLVWTGTDISDDPADGAWSEPYTNSFPEPPPIIKVGFGTGSTPTLMGFGDDEDKLVVITDGAKRMNLVAFWRNEIPEGSQRIAGTIPVTCGLDPLPEWIQSEQSVAVYGYGAFVVNNIPENVDPELVPWNKILQVSLMGPAYDTSYGAERFQWNTKTHSWSSAWTRPDVSATSMVPIHTVSGNMAVINGYRPEYGWEVLGLDWDTGETVHQTIFGDVNYGNGAYALPQYLDKGDLLFNSIVGPIRVHYDKQK